LNQLLLLLMVSKAIVTCIDTPVKLFRCMRLRLRQMQLSHP
jgi:hypothetical protein